MSIRFLRTAARSDVGIVRSSNEDSAYAGPDLLVVADGMGGHAAGELASAAAVATFAELEPQGLDDDGAVTRMSDAVLAVSERIADVVTAHPEFAGMGTTLTALAWLGDPSRIALVHVGDSRAYLLRDHELSQLTRDHTYVQMLVDSGQLEARDAAHHPRRNLLMRTIDGIHVAEPDVSVREARVGDRFLLCSDGLSTVVPDPRLAQLLTIPDRTAAVTALVDAALAAGAPDNVTCIVADVVADDTVAGGGDSAAAAQPVVVGAAGERATRQRLPELVFPADAEPDAAAPVVHVTSAVVTSSDGPGALATVYTERLPARGRRWRPALAVVLAVVLTLAAVTVALAYYTSRQWYVGEQDGNVSVFQGIPATVGPITLHWVQDRTDLPLSTLPTYEAAQVRASIFATSQAAAEETVTRLRTRAAQCVEAPKTSGCPGTPA